MDTSENTTPAERIQPTRDRGGQWVRIGDKEYKVAPLNFKALRTHLGSLNRMGKLKEGAVPSDEDFMAMLGVIHSAIARNYPDVTQDEIEEELDLSNMFDVLNAVIGIAGLERKESGPGEALPVH